MKFVLNIQNGGYSLKELRLYLSHIKDAKVVIEAKKLYDKRSLNQNSYLWGVVYPLVLEGLLDVGYDAFTSVSDVHEYCKTMFLSREVVNHQTGEVIRFPVSTTEMDTKEFGTYIDSIRLWAAEYLSVVIPDAKI
ncbi:MAG: hypothetical protein MJZ98_00465 [Paludibacteraceae bacterium]|nr:hypothetical protein [Paludibacteraceae bacterium]